MQVQRIPAEYVDDVWDVAAPLLAKALAQTYGEFTLDDIRDSILDGERQLHLIGDLQAPCAAAVTELVQYPRRRAIRIHLLGGELLNGWKQAFEDHLIAGARNAHAEQIEFIGRPGWARIFEHGDKRAVRMTIIREVAL